MRTYFLFALLAVGLTACQQESTPQAAPGSDFEQPSSPSLPSGDELGEPQNDAPGESDSDERTARPTAAETGPAVEVALAQGGGLTVPTRPRRRMNVDQLAIAMRQVSGGIGWTEQRGGSEVDLFEQLSTTLGKPDFAQATDEDLDPSTVFQKFLDDAARVTCTRMIASDSNILAAEEAGEPIEGSLVLLVHAGPEDTYETNADAVDANLIAALQRFHGRVFTDRSDPGLTNWRWLFKSSVFVTGEANQAWLGVCLALFTHPDFYTY